MRVICGIVYAMLCLVDVLMSDACACGIEVTCKCPSDEIAGAGRTRLLQLFESSRRLKPVPLPFAEWLARSEERKRADRTRWFAVLDRWARSGPQDDARRAADER